ncbi:uncharacterized protein TNCV_1161571 [Trichonephila clavipes]|nr:uncharacterized protein TNCV_1161571 [Trichonephila clavipes]
MLSRENDPQSKGGQVEQSERWAIIQLFHGYDASHVVSPFPPLPPTCYPVTMVTIRGMGRKTTSVRFFTLTQNWENFSFTFERKEVSLQKLDTTNR